MNPPHPHCSRRSSFSDLCQSKYAKDERFRAVEKMRDKEDLFKDFIAEIRRREKEESRSQKEKVSRSFSPQCDVMLRD
jgi:transcription elongation regulator 1